MRMPEKSIDLSWIGLRTSSLHDLAGKVSLASIKVVAAAAATAAVVRRVQALEHVRAASRAVCGPTAEVPICPVSHFTALTCAEWANCTPPAGVNAHVQSGTGMQTGQSDRCWLAQRV